VTIFSLVFSSLAFGLTLSEDDNVFVATAEWQEIRPGQKVAAGLHYRMNLETGKKEAKLLDPSEVGGEHRVVATRKDEEEEKEAAAISEEDVKAVREQMAKFKVSKDIEQIKYLMANFHNATSAENKLAILDDLDFYMHQIDNARDFVSLGGFESLVEPTLRSRDDDNVTAAASVLLGSAVQSNEPVRRHATNSGTIVDALMNNLARSGQVASKTIFALSALLRDNPAGVLAFVDAGGLDRLVSDVLVTSPDGIPSSADVNVRAKIKCLSFVSQLWSDNADTVHPGPEFCTVFDEPGLFGLSGGNGATAAMDLGRTEVLSQVVSKFSSKCDLATKPLVREWLAKAKETVQQEIDDEDEDKDFLEYLQNIMANILSVQGGANKTEL